MTTVIASDGGTQAADPLSEWMASADERAFLYRLLADVFRREPSAQRLEEIRTDSYREALNEAGVDLGEAFYSTAIDEQVEELAVEFTRLFLLSPGGRIAPYESVQLPDGSGQLRGPESQIVLDYYGATGFVHHDEMNDMPDHISAELEYMAHLVGLESSSWANEKQEDALNAIRYQNDFFYTHLSNWVFCFLKKVNERAEHAYYVGFAELAREFMEQELSELSDRTKQAAQLINRV